MTKLFRYLPMLALTAGVAIASPACAARVYDTVIRAPDIRRRPLRVRSTSRRLRAPAIVTASMPVETTRVIAIASIPLAPDAIATATTTTTGATARATSTSARYRSAFERGYRDGYERR